MTKTVLIAVILLIFSGCSGKAMYKMAIDYGRYKANLEPKYMVVNEELNVSYLENDVESETTLILIHGFAASKDNWLGLADKLDDKYHLIIPDLIGNGGSSKPQDFNYSIANQTQMLHQFLQKLDTNSTVLIANSMGGAISLNYVYMYNNIKALVLIDSLGIKVEDSVVDKMGVKKIKETWLNICSVEKLRTLMKQGMKEPPYIPTSVLEYIVEHKCKASAFEEKKYRDILDEELEPLDDFSEKALHVSIPTLIIWGRDDKVLSYKNAYAFHENIASSELKILEGLGHVPMIESPQKVQEVIRPFLDKHLVE